MTYIKEIHDYSWYPIWYRAYQSFEPNSKLTNTLIKQKDEIKKWAKATRIRLVVDKKGYNYRFSSEKEFTMFLLKWS